MKIEELTEMADRTESQGLDRVILVINRGTAPRGECIRVKGMGRGEIVNVQEKDGFIQVVAWFNLKDVRRYIRLYNSAQT